MSELPLGNSTKAIILVLLGLIALILSFYQQTLKPYKQNELTLIQGSLTAKPKFTGFYKSSKKIKFELREYVGIEFQVMGQQMSNLKSRGFLKLSKGRKLSVFVSRNSYNKILSRQNNKGTINVVYFYGINTLEEVNKYNSENLDTTSWVLFIAGLFCFGGALSLVKYRR